MVKEIWLPVPGYESHYEVSNRGNVRSKERVVEWKNKYGGLTRATYPSVLLRRIKQRGKNTTYDVVSLSFHGKMKRRFISRLVLAAFKGLDLSRSDLFACHIDDNGENNALENLFIGTVYDNVHDAMKKGRLDNAGSKNGMAKFTKQQVIDMREMFSKGAKLKQVMQKFNISMTGAHHIKSGNRWKF